MNQMTISFIHLKSNTIVYSQILPEPVKVIVTIPLGNSLKLIGKGLKTNQVHEIILETHQLSKLVISPEKEPFDGDPVKFRLGIEAMRLSLAYE